MTPQPDKISRYYQIRDAGLTECAKAEELAHGESLKQIARGILASKVTEIENTACQW